MTRPWIGSVKYLFIPLVVEGTAGYHPPPANYREFVQRRVFFDPDAQTNEDRSLMSYIASISYGRASIDATVSRPITLTNLRSDDNPTILAINAHPNAHEFEYLAVVYPPNSLGAGGGMAQPGSIEFDPPRTPNRTRARSRFLFDERIGAWAMEILHNVTDIGDYYNGVLHPGRFDEMADSVATHPSSYTKIVAGWLDPFEVATHPGGRHRYTLHAIGLPHPSPAGRVACVKVQTLGSERYLIIEARLKSDRWDRGFSGSKGIKSEGVVVYEFSPETNPWPRVHPNGPWPPLELRTPTALTEGQSFTHADTGTTITVFAAVAGFVIEVTTDDITVPDVRELRATVAAARIRAAGLQPKFIGTPGSQAWVRSQSPKAGTGAPPGSIVTLNLSSGPIP